MNQIDINPEKEKTLTQKLKRMFYSIIFIVLAVYFGISTLFLFLEKYIIFHPFRELEETPSSIGLKYDDIYFDTKDGVSINAWFIPAENSKGTVLFCHGNAGNISHRLDTIKIYNQLGLDFFIFDYRGYGKSGGSISENGLYLDSETAWDYLVSVKKIPPEKIVIVGRSLGASVAARLACSRTSNPAGAVIESAFLSVYDMAAYLYPWLPCRFFLRFNFPTKQYVQYIECPKLMVHSKDDEIVPFSHGKKLFELAKEPKIFLELSGGHNECYFENEKIYRKALGDFCNSVLATKKGKEQDSSSAQSSTP